MHINRFFTRMAVVTIVALSLGLTGCDWGPFKSAETVTDERQQLVDDVAAKVVAEMTASNQALIDTVAATYAQVAWVASTIVPVESLTMVATIDSTSIGVDTLTTLCGFGFDGQVTMPGTGYLVRVVAAHDSTGTASAFDSTAVTMEQFQVRVTGATATIAAATIARAAATYDPANPLAQIQAMTAHLTSGLTLDSTVASATR